jgi:exosortase
VAVPDGVDSIEQETGALRPGAGQPVWIGLHVLGVAGFLFAFSSLLTLGTRYSFAKGVEYWLFRPTDNAPLVILGLSLWLAYRRWYKVRALPLRSGPGWLAASALVLGALVQVWAVYTSAADLQVFALVFDVVGLVTLYWGVPGLRVLWLPIAFLLFAIPMPAPLLLAIVWKLQIFTADYAGWMLHVLGLPALVSGDQILRATQAFQVIEGCSGLRSTETLSMLTVLMIDLFRRRGWHAAILILAAPVLAVFLNGLRVLTLILNPHSEIIAIHNLQGIAILLAGLLIVYFIDGLLERVSFLTPGPERSFALSDGRFPFRPKTALAGLLISAGMACAIYLWLPIWHDESQPPDLYALMTEAFDEWPSQKGEPDFVFRGSARFGQVFDRIYTIDGHDVSVFVATADFGQRGGSPISRLTAQPGTGWRPRSSEWPRLEPGSRRVEERVLEKGKRRVLLYHFYEGNRGLAVETLRALFALDRSPLRRAESLAVVRIATSIRDRSEAAHAESRERLQAAYERLEPVLQVMGGEREENGAARHAAAPPDLQRP